MLSKQSWIKEWTNCQKCPLHLNARHHVLYRGTIPADCLLIGEAPGKTEDKLGKPFIGRSGQLLSTAIQRLGLTSYCISNVVCCIPLKQESEFSVDGTYPKDVLSIRPPSKEEAAACSPHLSELVKLCSPKIIALLGNEPKKYFPLNMVPEGTRLVTLRHPAFVLRRGGENSVEFKRFLETFHSALDEVGIPHTFPFQPIGA